MNENEPRLPEKIRKALKESPTLTPPESFYRGVLKEMERRQAPAEEKAPWYWGYPAKGLATACVLLVMVLITRETRKPPPEPARNAPVAASTPAVDDLKALAKTKEVQERLQNPISNLVGAPSPFEEVDKETRRSLREQRKDAAAEDTQARDTVGGMATQGSFIDQQSVLAKKQKEYTAIPQAAALGQLSERAVPEMARAASPISMPQTPQEWKGLYSGISSFQTVVVRTPDDWQKLWRDHNGYIVPPPPLPPIDFSNFMVVGIFDGTKPSGGYAVEITGVKTFADGIVVTYIEISPATGAAMTQALTEPFHLRIVPKSSLPVRFEKL